MTKRKYLIVNNSNATYAVTFVSLMTIGYVVMRARTLMSIYKHCCILTLFEVKTGERTLIVADEANQWCPGDSYCSHKPFHSVMLCNGNVNNNNHC